MQKNLLDACSVGLITLFLLADTNIGFGPPRDNSRMVDYLEVILGPDLPGDKLSTPDKFECIRRVIGN